MAKVPEAPRKRIVVVDDYPIVRQGVVELINDSPGFTVVGEAEDVASALVIIEQQSPDMVVSDITLKNSSGIDLIRGISERWPEIPVMVFSMHDESFYAERVLRAGARGYVTKGDQSTRLIEGLGRLNDPIYIAAWQQEAAWQRGCLESVLGWSKQTLSDTRLRNSLLAG